MSQGTTLLVVCTGNICRSPAVELLLRRRLDRTVAISSAGTHALVGQPVSPPMAELLQARGLDVSTFRARALRPDMVEEATLVVTMTVAQRAAVVRMVPAAVRRTFTLLELAQLLSTSDGPASTSGEDSPRWAQVPSLAMTERFVHLDSRRSLDVADPYRKPDRVYRRTLEQVSEALDTICTVVEDPRRRERIAQRPWTPTVSDRSEQPYRFENPDVSRATPGRPRHGRRPRWL